MTGVQTCALPIYDVTGRGGNREVLDRWIGDIVYHNDVWQGTIHGEPQEFLATLRLLEAEIISLKQGRASLEEFFMEQMEIRGIRSST